MKAISFIVVNKKYRKKSVQMSEREHCLSMCNLPVSHFQKYPFLFTAHVPSNRIVLLRAGVISILTHQDGNDGQNMFEVC